MKTAILTVIAILVVLIIITFLLCGLIFSNLICTKPISVPDFIVRLVEKFLAGSAVPDSYPEDAARAEERLKELPFEDITLKAPDSAKLRGHVLRPRFPNGCVVIACHGARSNALGEFCFMIPELYKQGYTFVLPEHRGCGISDGKFMGYGTHESKDTFQWLDYTQKRFPDYDVFLLGVSMGAATVLMMSDRLKNTNVRGVISDCSYTSGWNEFAYQLKTSFHLPAFPLLFICDLYCRCYARYSFKDAAPIETVKRAAVPVLFIHGKKDDYVPFYMQGELYAACTAPKELLAVENAVHARSCYTAPDLYNKAITDFMMKNRKYKKSGIIF